MSGHSHWATIKRKKTSEDQQRGKMFSKLSRAISLAARSGIDPDFNSKLRKALDEAKKYNVPQENIKRAIEKGSGVGEGFKEIRLEGYGPSGVAIMLEALTDNKNRTISEIRNIFQRYGGSLGEEGSAAYIFKDPEKPLFDVEITNKETAKKVLSFVDALDEHEDVQEVYANFNVPEGFLKE